MAAREERDMSSVRVIKVGGTNETMRLLGELSRQIHQLRAEANAIALAHNHAVERAAAESGTDGAGARVRWDEETERYHCADRRLARRLIG